MKYQRIKAFGLAMAMVFTMLPASAVTVSAATDKPQLAFTSGDGGDPTKAFIITGRSIGLIETTPTGYVASSPTVTNVSGTVISSGITIPSTHDSVQVDADFNPGTGLKDGTVNESLSAEAVYTINGNYYALLAEGEVTEKNGDRGPLGGVITSTTSSAITQYSSCTIECVQAEYLNSPPQFVIVDGSATGAFLPFATGATVVVDKYTQNASAAKELAFHFLKGNNRIDFVMNPQLVYSYQTVNQGTANDAGVEVTDDNGNPILKEADNYIRKGTTFDLIFQMPASDPLFLTVMTPQAAMEQIEEQIKQSDGVSNTSFLEFESGDALSYITEDFTLRGFSSQFNALFKIEWAWEPSDTQTVDGVEVTLGSLPMITQTRYREAIVPGGGNAEQQRAMVTAQEDDIKGTLTAKVSYNKPGGDYQETVTVNLPVKNVVVRGTGKAVNVTQVSQIQGSTVTNFDETNTALPGAKTMDAYRGDIPEYQLQPKGPYQYDLQLNMGAKNGAARYATVTVEGNSSAIILRTQQGSDAPADYTSGSQIPNNRFGLDNNMTPGLVNLTILAQKLPADSGRQTAALTVRFFIPDRNGVPRESSSKFTIQLNLEDSTPSQDSTLASLIIKDQENEAIDYPFSSSKFTYTGPTGTIHIPYKSESITLTPVLYDPRGAQTPIIITRLDTSGKQIGDPVTVYHENASTAFEFPELGQVATLMVQVPSQDPRQEYWSTYQLDIVRDRPSEDATLSSLAIYYPDDDRLRTNLISGFKPETLEYFVEIPYSTERLRVRAAVGHDRASGPEISPALEGTTLFDPDKQWLNNLRDKFAATTDGILDLTFTVTSEAGTTKTYTVHLRRLDPNDDATLKSLKVTDVDERALTTRPASFKSDVQTYTVEIPYSTSQIKLNLTPTDAFVRNVQVYTRSVEAGNLLFDKLGGQLKYGAATPAMDVLPIDDDAIRTVGYHAFFIVVTAENELTTMEYEVRVQRAEPSDDAMLKSLVIRDQDSGELKTFAFHPDETSYGLEVPYEMTQVSFTPTASHTGAAIQIKEEGIAGLLPYNIESGATSKLFKLDGAGDPKQFDITVTAEDGETDRTYTITLTRGQPSSDARLKGLVTQNTSEFAPIFISKTTEYEAVVEVGAPGVIITATANHAGATIRIDGNVVASGTPSEIIELIEIYQKIDIVVTAQDGVTTMTYTIEFTNENLIEKTSNADLRRLTVNYGLMTPKFKAAITEYEVTATENTYAVDIIPKTSDELATMRVFAGTKELGDYRGNYSQALADGDNEITIEVTSADETVTKTYTVTIYRNEEDKLKNLTPLEAADIDFENSPNPIVVKIDEYPRIAASVFEELRANYPDKTIIFEGNDYSLEFQGSQLDWVIPQAEVYDFRMSFISPDEDAVFDIIEDSRENDDILNDVVMLYFYYHGSLPGPATFYLSLGRQYASQPLYWHYYNQERDRIDYYGMLQSNSKGNITLGIDHFSTYVITPEHRIIGAENKLGAYDEYGRAVDNDPVVSVVKVHPLTGTREEPK